MADETGAVTTQRLFFALWPDPGLQHQLAQAATALLPAGTGRRVPESNLHSTLVFLGSVTAAQRACVEAAADMIRAEPFILSIDRFGYFRRPQVAWLGSSRIPGSLLELVNGLGEECSACGFPPEKRPFAIHVTVARKISRDPGRHPFLPIEWPVNRFALVESRTAPGGVQYTPCRFWALE